MNDAGRAAEQVQRFLSTINLPWLSQKVIADRQKELDRPIDSIVTSSLDDSLEEEKATVKENMPTDNTCSDDVEPAIAIQYDMCWQKRGSGRQYNSMSGVGCAIGPNTGKVLGFDILSKACRKCANWETKGKQAPDHECSRNWFESSKAMESGVGATIASELEQKNCKTETLIMDDDSTTINRIEKTVKHKVTKLSDYNHTKKQLTGKLWKLNASYKKEMTPAAIGHFRKCFSFALNRNKNDSSAMSANLRELVPHFFGQHKNCGKNWCEFHRNPQTYKQTILLTNQNLRSEMEKIMEPLLKNIEKNAPCASTRSNESFNNMVAQKAPKSRHYCSSASLKTRVKCAVAQKNNSYKYVSDINQKCGLSPGKMTARRCQIMEEQRKGVLRYTATSSFKRRRLEKLSQMAKTEVTKELQEGVTYETGCGLTNSEAVETISSPTKPPEQKQVELKDGKAEMVFFDIETTSLAFDCDIVQLSARHDSSSFNAYMIPSKPINKKASEITGLTMINNVLCHKGRPVGNETTPLIAGTDFVSWLHEIPNPVILYGHNCKSFDSPRLLKLLQSCRLIGAFTEKVLGFVDTLPLYRDKYPEFKNHKKEYLISKCLDIIYDAQNAVDDVQSLMMLVKTNSPDISSHMRYSFSTKSATDKLIHSTETDKRMCSLNPLISNKTLTKSVAKKVAESGLDMDQLKLAHRCNEEDGVKLIFTEKFEGKCSYIIY